MKRNLALVAQHAYSEPPTAASSLSDARQRRRNHTYALFQAVQAAPNATAQHAAMRQVVELNMGVARTLARSYLGRGVPTDDLYQVAYAALVRAARDFDPSHDVDFLSYAVPTIRGEIRRYFRDVAWTIRPPRRVQELQAAISSARATLQQALGASPTAAEIALELGVPVADVNEAQAAQGCFTPSSLDLPLNEDSNATAGDQLGSLEAGYDLADVRSVLRPALAKLGLRDRSIVRMRFYDGLTQREIGDAIGVTQMQVSRLLTRILGELRQELADPKLMPA